MRYLWAAVTAFALTLLLVGAIDACTAEAQWARDLACATCSGVSMPHAATGWQAGSVQLPDQRPMSLPEQWQPVYSPTIESMLGAVSATLLSETICQLQSTGQPTYCSELGTRYSYDMASLDEASRYLYQEFAGLGLSVAYDPFVWASTPMTNVVAELPGTGPHSHHIYIVCAHYDSYAHPMDGPAPGADDDASGCAAVVEAARILSQHCFPRTLRFVLFAGEEQWMRGSEHYAAEAAARGDRIDGVINLDMIGYESVPPGDHVIEIHAGTRPDSILLADALIQCITLYDLNLAPEKLTTTAVTYCDQAPFWNHGYAGIMCIEDFQDFNPHYHKASDTLANVQLPLVVEFTRATVAVLAELASARDTIVAPVRLYLPLIVSR